MRLVISVLALFSLSACYTYSPVSYDTVQPAADVTIELTSNGTVKYEPVLGPRVEGVEGSVMRLSPDSLQLGIRKVSYRGGTSQIWSGEPLGFEKSSFDHMRQRKVSVAKSAAFAAGIGAVFALIVQADIFGFGADNPTPSPSPRPDPGGN